MSLFCLPYLRAQRGYKKIPNDRQLVRRVGPVKTTRLVEQPFPVRCHLEAENASTQHQKGWKRYDGTGVHGFSRPDRQDKGTCTREREGEGKNEGGRTHVD